MKETNLKSGRLITKLQETREPYTIIEFYMSRSYCPLDEGPFPLCYTIERV